MRRFLAPAVLTACALLLSSCWKTAEVPSVPGQQSASASSRSNPALSFEQVKKLADSGDNRAQFELGAMYHDGDGVAKDRKKALEWYRTAADGGNRQAQFNLGLMYKNGEGVPANLETARKWFIKASDAGDVRASFQLGLLSYQGTGVIKDMTKALQYFTKAAMGGLAEAQVNVGVMHLRAEGVIQDVIEGYAWLSIAKENGSTRAAGMLKDLTEKLTVEQEKQGKELAAKLKAEMKATETR